MSTSLLEKLFGSAETDFQPLHWKSAQFLRNLLFTKLYNDDLVIVDDGKVQITLGDLKVKQENVLRPNGTVGTHYPNIYALSQAEGSKVIESLKAMPDKPRQNTSGNNSRRPAAAEQQTSLSVSSASELMALLQQAAKENPAAVAAALGLADSEPAKPVAAKGHRVIHRETVDAVTDNGETVEIGDIPEFHSGDVIMVNGVLRQISADGQRLNKTIV